MVDRKAIADDVTERVECTQVEARQKERREATPGFFDGRATKGGGRNVLDKLRVPVLRHVVDGFWRGPTRTRASIIH